jgi:hypothetical protein
MNLLTYIPLILAITLSACSHTKPLTYQNTLTLEDGYFGSFDADKNKIITRAEWLTKSYQDFLEFDKNSDGVFILEELPGPKEYRPSSITFDKDQDGKGTAGEFLVSRLREYEERNSNSDEGVSREELFYASWRVKPSKNRKTSK